MKDLRFLRQDTAGKASKEDDEIDEMEGEYLFDPSFPCHFCMFVDLYIMISMSCESVSPELERKGGAINLCTLSA
jgi:hypothetical protein